MLTPSRLYGSSLATAISVKSWPLNRCPRRYTCSNSRGFLRRHALGSPNRFTGSRRQLSASLGPSPSYHGLPGPCSHSQPETMGSFTLDITGLKCSFTHYSYPFVCSFALPVRSQCCFPSSRPFGHKSSGYPCVEDNSNAGPGFRRNEKSDRRAYYLLC